MREKARSRSPSRTRLEPTVFVVRGTALGFIVIGLLGFIPVVTTDLAGLTMAGPGSTAMLFGVFQISVVHNVVHLLYGVFGLALASPPRAAVVFLVGGGAGYFMIWLYGSLVDLTTAANIFPLNTADNWLHLFLAIGMTGAGLAFGRAERSRGQADAAPVPAMTHRT